MGLHLLHLLWEMLGKSQREASGADAEGRASMRGREQCPSSHGLGDRGQRRKRNYSVRVAVRDQERGLVVATEDGQQVDDQVKPAAWSLRSRRQVKCWVRQF